MKYEKFLYNVHHIIRIDCCYKKESSDNRIVMVKKKWWSKKRVKMIYNRFNYPYYYHELSSLNKEYFYIEEDKVYIKPYINFNFMNNFSTEMYFESKEELDIFLNKFLNQNNINRDIVQLNDVH